MPSVKVWVSPIDRKHPASDAITPQNNTAPQRMRVTLVNLTGLPAASVPVGFTAEGLPIELRIMGRHLDDRGVLALAAVAESLYPMRDRRPPVSVGVADHRRP